MQVSLVEHLLYLANTAVSLIYKRKFAVAAVARAAIIVGGKRPDNALPSRPA